MMVVAMLAILGAISMAMYGPYRQRARCTEAEVAAYDTMLALQQTLAETGNTNNTVDNLAYTNTKTIGGQNLNYPTNVTVRIAGAGTTPSQPFSVDATRINPACPRGDGIYTLNQGDTQGQW